MTGISIIFFLTAAALGFFLIEYPAVFGVYVPTCALKRFPFKFLTCSALVLGLLLCGHGGVADSVSNEFGNMRPAADDMFLLVLAAVIIVVVLKIFSIEASAVYAMLGTMVAYHISCMDEGGMHLSFYLSFVAAPVMSFVISALLRYIFKRTLSGSHIHLLTLSYYMRSAVIIAIMLTAFAIGLNYGGFLVGGGSLMIAGNAARMAAVIVVAAVMLLTMPFMRHEGADDTGIYSDFSIYAVVSTGFAVALTTLFFSFDSLTSILGLEPVPLSVATLVMAAVAGTETAQKSRLLSADDYVRAALSCLVTPFGALLLAYILLHLSGSNVHEDGSMAKFIVMTAATAVLLAVVFVAYVRRQRNIRLATDRLVYSQQQQIYENSRALHEMELKVIVSENQALHRNLEMKRQEVMNVALGIVEQKEYLESLNDLVKQLAKAEEPVERKFIINELSASLKQRLSYDTDVDSSFFYAQAESLHEDFNAKLSENFPTLTTQERRLATLLRLGFPSKYIAILMNITPKSVEISRYRLRQKLGLSKGDNLVNFIKSI